MSRAFDYQRPGRHSETGDHPKSTWTCHSRRSAYNDDSPSSTRGHVASATTRWIDLRGPWMLSGPLRLPTDSSTPTCDHGLGAGSCCSVVTTQATLGGRSLGPPSSRLRPISVEPSREHDDRCLPRIPHVARTTTTIGILRISSTAAHFDAMGSDRLIVGRVIHGCHASAIPHVTLKQASCQDGTFT